MERGNPREVTFGDPKDYLGHSDVFGTVEPICLVNGIAKVRLGNFNTPY